MEGEQMTNASALRRALIIFGLMFALCAAVPFVAKLSAASPTAGLPSVKLDASAPGPREVEDLTGQNVTREYATAWQVMAQALRQNRSDLLDRSFVGVARDKLSARIASQQKNGLHTRFIDHGHNVKVAFYSPEGSTMQLLDTADVETQVLDGDKVLYSVRGPEKYIAIMTVAETGWRVREIETVPDF